MRLFVKIGGAVLEAAEERSRLAQSLAGAKAAEPELELALVHGGGKQIAKLAERLGLDEKRIEGLRITCVDTAEVVRWVLAGEVNKTLTHSLCAAGLAAIGLCGADLGIFTARRKTHPTTDLGFVGTLSRSDVHAERLIQLLSTGSIPVISTVGPEAGATAAAPFLNVNADEAAGPLAAAAKADELLFLSDVPGVLDKAGKVIPALTLNETQALIDNGTIHGGMIPKVRAALHAIEAGVAQVRILSGYTEDPLKAAREQQGTRLSS